MMRTAPVNISCIFLSTPKPPALTLVESFCVGQSLERKSLPWYLKDMQSMPLLLPTSYLRDNYQGFKEATGKGMSGL
jgi:hypothetical protein